MLQETGMSPMTTGRVMPRRTTKPALRFPLTDDGAVDYLLRFHNDTEENRVLVDRALRLRLLRHGLPVGRDNEMVEDSLHRRLTLATGNDYSPRQMSYLLGAAPANRDGCRPWSRQELTVALDYAHTPACRLLVELKLLEPDDFEQPEMAEAGHDPRLLHLLDSFWEYRKSDWRRVTGTLTEFGAFVSQVPLQGWGRKKRFAVRFGETLGLKLRAAAGCDSSSAYTSFIRLLNGVGGNWTVATLEELAAFAGLTPTTMMDAFARWEPATAPDDEDD